MVRNGRTMLEDGSYYAGTDGAVDRVRPEHESEWEKLGRDLRDGWDHLMNGTEEAVDQTGRPRNGRARAPRMRRRTLGGA